MDKIGDILSAATASPASPTVSGQAMTVIGPDVQNIVDQSEAFESVAQVITTGITCHIQITTQNATHFFSPTPPPAS